MPGAKRWLKRRLRPVWQVAWAVKRPANRGGRIKAALRTARHEVVTRRLGRPVRARIGQRSTLIVYPGETNARLAVYQNPPNWPEMLVWSEVLKPGDLFLDIGANIGMYTIYAAELGAEVIAVEPNSHNVARIHEHLELNGYDATVISKALSDAPGRLRMTENLDSLNHITDGAGVEVEATTLDEILGDRTAAGVKVDVEGAELLVLRGAERALLEHRITVLQLEWQLGEWMVADSRQPVAEILRSSGYVLLQADDHGRLRPECPTLPPSINRFAVPDAHIAAASG